MAAQPAVPMRRDLQNLGGVPHKNHRLFGRGCSRAEGKQVDK